MTSISAAPLTVAAAVRDTTIEFPKAGRFSMPASDSMVRDKVLPFLDAERRDGSASFEELDTLKKAFMQDPRSVSVVTENGRIVAAATYEMKKDGVAQVTALVHSQGDDTNPNTLANKAGLLRDIWRQSGATVLIYDGPPLASSDYERIGAKSFPTWGSPTRYEWRKEPAFK